MIGFVCVGKGGFVSAAAPGALGARDGRVRDRGFGTCHQGRGRKPGERAIVF